MPADDQKGDGRKPDYQVYRSRPGLLSRLRPSGLDALREKIQKGQPPPPPPPPGVPPIPGQPLPGEPERKRGITTGRVAKWSGIFIAAWFLLSLLTFGISAQIQKSKLADPAKNLLGGDPFLLASAQTILVIGTDARPPDSQDEVASARCLERAAGGASPGEGCPGFRSDTLMLVRAGGGAFRKLSIPRDSLAEIPGFDAQKINAAYAFGGAELTVKTVEAFLPGIEIDHVVIVDFEGFEEFIDAIGGVEVELDSPVCSLISGGTANGGFEQNLPAGESTLSGEEALTLARTRNSDCDGDGVSDANFNDLDRVRSQQLILSGIKGRLTDPLRLPINFLKGPLIGWTAPKAFVSDLGVLTMPQLVLASVIGGDGDPEVLVPSGEGPGGSLIIDESERRAAVELLLEG